MKIYQLEQLAKAAIDNHLPMMLKLDTRHTILAMISVIRAADAVRKDSPHISDKLLRSYDEARAKLEEL